ncbi:2-dehydro-3-deoxyphosphogalactonate aldolase [Sphingomonas sp. SORGH_AS870]|uniref:2-dehydro-3-deoxy-6-phosphogalactonate aldolase n=1 Tax=Sphingomonas sp. SORGH_AS_0870 TaxID=3041801 RepID=UPI0028635623|nr:2-dehydro-3-deoxy-6-phosphogalactonate aldolase [Sphingomonas sp. SORGH_AS_0870]MDR6145835.1 2-dehydro-3-deoxyphosphogalactonate aldolase [Sphingomonas sp. SORGH_AS_0870]
MKTLFSDIMADLPLVAILRGITPTEVEAVGDELVEAGFRLIEVPLTSPDPFDSIARLAGRWGQGAIVGAGTVRRIDQLDRLIEAGGRLMVTPHGDPALIAAACARGLVTLPGVATPTEALAALDAGADGLKLYPAEMIPPSAVKAFRTVIGPGVPLCPTGGIEPEDLAPYVAAGADGFGLGGALYRPGDTAEDVAVRAAAFVSRWKTLHG